MATLKDAKIGQTVRVKKLTGEGAVSAASWTWASQRVLKSTSARLLPWETR